jgi:hypothetical protein
VNDRARRTRLNCDSRRSGLPPRGTFLCHNSFAWTVYG